MAKDTAIVTMEYDLGNFTKFSIDTSLNDLG